MHLEVRPALVDDIERIVDLGESGHGASEHNAFPFDAQKSRMLVCACITHKKLCAYVATWDGKIVGFVLGQEQEHPYAKMTFASDIALYAVVPGAGRKLHEAFAKWALESRKVDQLIMGVSHGGKSAKATEAWYRRMGYSHVGGIFVKRAM